MDKAKGVLKGGWHPSGDASISRKTWKSDLKGLATGKKDDQATRAESHVSAPLTSLKDPDSFGPPPKHSAYYPGAQSPAASSPSGSIASSRPAVPSRSATGQAAAAQQEEVKAPQGPYRVDTTGLRTDNLPKPPVRRDGPSSSTPASATTSRPVPNLPPRQNTGGRPPPVLPPRQNETPNEYTPEPPPSYGEATQPSSPATALSQSAVNRLGRAGVSVPGFGIGEPTTSQTPAAPAQSGHGGQLSELQQRFARMNTSSSSKAENPPATTGPSWRNPTTQASNIATTPTATGSASNIAVPAGAKKKPPPPPAKRSDLQDPHAAPMPPPVPMSSKPRPG